MCEQPSEDSLLCLCHLCQVPSLSLSVPLFKLSPQRPGCSWVVEQLSWHTGGFCSIPSTTPHLPLLPGGKSPAAKVAVDSAVRLAKPVFAEREGRGKPLKMAASVH